MKNPRTRAVSGYSLFLLQWERKIRLCRTNHQFSVKNAPISCIKTPQFIRITAFYLSFICYFCNFQLNSIRIYLLYWLPRSKPQQQPQRLPSGCFPYRILYLIMFQTYLFVLIFPHKYRVYTDCIYLFVFICIYNIYLYSEFGTQMVHKSSILYNIKNILISFLRL